MDVLSFDWLFSPSSHNDSSLHVGDRASGAPQPSPDIQVAGTATTANDSFLSRLATFGSIRPTQDAFGHSGRSGVVLGADATTSPEGAATSDDVVNSVFETPFWTFLTSKYAVSLVIMGVLVNRIHHICQPRGGRPVRLKGWKRLAIRLPALLALGAATVALGLRVVQLWAGEYVPGQSWLADGVANLTSLRLDETRKKDDEKLLWVTYISACLGIVTESLTRTLEAAQEPSPSFNLIGFSLSIQSHQLEPVQVSFHFFLFVFMEIAEVLCLTLMSCWQKPPLKRLHITTFFGLAAALHYLLAPSQRRPMIFGFDKMPEVCMLGIVLVTILLHSLTMLMTEGSINASRLLFSSSNLPSSSDDYSLALFKLGTACLQSTRLTGLSRELVSIEVPEKTFIEVDEAGGVRLQIGLEGLIRGEGGEGLHNEIRITTPVSSSGRGWTGTGEYESAVLMSGAKWREIKRFLFAVLAVAGTIWRAITSRIPQPPPSWSRRLVPHWISKVPRWTRLVWHGQNGERRREERLSRLRVEHDRQEKLRKEALRAILSRSGVEVGEGEDANLAAWRAMKNGIQSREADMRYRRMHEGRETPEELMGISSTLWKHLLTATEEPNAQLGPSVSDDAGEEEEDGDWTLEEYGEDDEASDSASEDGQGFSSAFLNRRGTATSRSPTRSRSSSPFTSHTTARDAAAAAAIARTSSARHLSPLHQQHSGENGGSPEREGDEEEAEETPLSLLQLARRAFSPSPGVDGTAEQEGGESDTFSRVLLVHAAAPDGSPIVTRARYRSLVESSRGAQESKALSSSTQSFDHLHQTILRRRLPPPAAGSSEEESRVAERERLRLCVVCCYEERTILCWPCRCLALCDGCREELASRPGRSGGGSDGANSDGGLHDCPTCRSKVRGFSRIYLP